MCWKCAWCVWYQQGVQHGCSGRSEAQRERDELGEVKVGERDQMPHVDRRQMTQSTVTID